MEKRVKKWHAHGKRGLDFFCWLALIVMTVTVYSGVKIYLDNRTVKAQISKLKAEAQKFESENEVLRKSADHGTSEIFVEKEARTKLNMQKPGETAVFINRQSEMTAAGNIQDNDTGPWANAHRWWQMFFGR